MDERDDDDLRLPAAAVLDTWTVPEPGMDLADRIADAWQDERTARGTVPRRRAPGGLRGVMLGAAMGAAAAIVVMLLVRPPAREPAGPTPVATPEAAAVVAPTPVLPPAKTPASEDDLAAVKADLERIRQDIERSESQRDEFLLALDVEPDDARVRVTMGDRTVADVVGDVRLLLPREPFEAKLSAPGHRPSTLYGNPEIGPETKLEVQLTREPTAARDRSPFRRWFKRKAKPNASSGDLKNPFARDDDPVKSATLRIGTTPGSQPARVYVDGVYLGTTPIQSHKLTPGTHTVEWIWDDGKKVSERIELAKDEIKAMKRG